LSFIYLFVCYLLSPERWNKKTRLAAKTA